MFSHFIYFATYGTIYDITTWYNTDFHSWHKQSILFNANVNSMIIKEKSYKLWKSVIPRYYTISYAISFNVNKLTKKFDYFFKVQQ